MPSYSDLDNRQHTNVESDSSSISIGAGGPTSTVVSNIANNVTANLTSTLNSGAGLPGNQDQNSQTQSVISAAHITLTNGDPQSQEAVATLTSRDAATANQGLTDNLTLQQAQDIARRQRQAQENAQAAQMVGQGTVDQLEAVLCVLQNCDINGMSGTTGDPNMLAAYNAGIQMRTDNPKLFQQLTQDIQAAGLLSGQFDYQPGGFDFGVDAIGLRLQGSVYTPFGRFVDNLTTTPESWGDWLAGAAKGAGNMNPDLQVPAPILNDDQARGAALGQVVTAVGATVRGGRGAGAETGGAAEVNAAKTPMINGVKVVDRNTGAVYKGTVDLQPTIDRIASGGAPLSRNDGITFNNNEGLLPKQPSGYYMGIRSSNAKYKWAGAAKDYHRTRRRDLLRTRPLSVIHPGK
jgi:hypothetical protein